MPTHVHTAVLQLIKKLLLCVLLVLTASVSMTALDDNPTVGESFSMECNVTMATSVIGSVDITWSVNGTMKRRVNDTVGDTNSEYVLHRDVYNITVLQLSDDNTVYYCEAMVNKSVPLKGNDSITIMLTYGKYSFIRILILLNISLFYHMYISLLYRIVHSLQYL